MHIHLYTEVLNLILVEIRNLQHIDVWTSNGLIIIKSCCQNGNGQSVRIFKILVIFYEKENVFNVEKNYILLWKNVCPFSMCRLYYTHIEKSII
jgi:hypothetical protein